MIGKRRYAIWSLGLALLSGCGDSTPPDAVINTVDANRTTIYSNNTVPTAVASQTIHFKVQLSATDTSPVSGAKVDLSGTSPTVGDTNSGFVGGVVGGGFLNPADPNHFEITSDANGVVSAVYQFTVPACESGASAVDLVVSAVISASIGGSSTTWIDNITITKC
jgi:hypothetical protein